MIKLLIAISCVLLGFIWYLMFEISELKKLIITYEHFIENLNDEEIKKFDE